MNTFILCPFLLVTASNSARILGVFPYPSISHHFVFQQIYKGLSLQGHEVIVVTSNPLNDSTLVNLTEIDTGKSYRLIPQDEGIKKLYSKDLTRPQVFINIYDAFLEVQEHVFQNKDFIKIYNNSEEKFDLILVEGLTPGLQALGGRFDAPFIVITSMGSFSCSYDLVGNPSHPLLSQELLINLHEKPMTIIQKIRHVYNTLWFRWYHHFVGLPVADRVMRKYLGNNIPYLGDIEKNVSMLFININPILYPPRPNVPAVLEIGLSHIKPIKPLPEDLKAEMDKTTGVVYFSLGSNVKSNHITDELKEILISTVEELPYTVLMKWDEDHMPRRPNNVITRKWFPQSDVLAHPNVKVFVTQGGLQSCEEAMARAIPVVGVPFFSDQPMNIQRMVDRGMGEIVDPDSVTKEELKEKIMKVATDLSYKKNIEEIRDKLQDEPIKPVDRAVWWAEYVIRHKGMGILRSPIADAPWYEYFLLDVIGAVLLVLVFASYLSYRLSKWCLGLLISRAKVKTN